MDGHIEWMKKKTEKLYSVFRGDISLCCGNVSVHMCNMCTYDLLLCYSELKSKQTRNARLPSASQAFVMHIDYIKFNILV
jgi:hypothetical protein